MGKSEKRKNIQPNRSTVDEQLNNNLKIERIGQTSFHVVVVIVVVTIAYSRCGGCYYRCS